MIKFAVAEGLAALARRNEQDRTPARRAIGLFDRPDFDVLLYAPIGADYPQGPHARDELYVIASGTGKFTCADETETLGEGDVFFVPGGVEHGFSDLSADFATWVIFFGASPSQSPAAA